MTAAPPLPEALLLDYAAGAAGPATGLLIETHLQMSKASRDIVVMMEAMGGALLDECAAEPLERLSAADLFDKLDDIEETSPGGSSTIVPDPMAASALMGMPLERTSMRKGAPETFTPNDLPTPLRDAEIDLGGDRRWRWIGIGVAATELAASDDKERAHLLWAKGGTGIAEHCHVGRETVLVLKGAFWDDGVRYGPGDVAVCEDGTVHRPRIDEGDDCLCLAVTEAPVHFTGVSGVVLNRLCRF